MNYYALGNVVYKENGEVACVVAPVWFVKSIACLMARMIAEVMTKAEYDERDVLRGSLD